MFKTVIGVLGLLLLTAGLLLAQTPEVTPEPFDCNSLIEAQAELNERLATFATDDEQTRLKNLYEVGKAYQEMALTCGYIPDDIETMVINTTDMERIENVLLTLYGDPLRGQLLYNGQENSGGGVTLGCSGCHADSENAPLTEGTWTRWDMIYSQEAQFAGYTFEQYALESIIHPWEYTVEGYASGVMPNFYHTLLSYQDLADLIAYLGSQDQE